MRPRPLFVIVSLCAATIGYAQTVDHPLQVGGNVVPPVLVHDVPVSEPRGGLSGKPKAGAVIVCGVVDREGVPQGFDVRTGLDEERNTAALDAVRQYRFQPATQEGNPVAVRLCIQMNFKVVSR